MNVIGYEAGPIACEAAFIADFDVDLSIPIVGLVSQMDSDRRTMAARAGMILKYMPLRFDPATGAHQIGGRYLFATRGDMLDYARFTSDELEFEPGVKFWERPVFGNIERQPWRVVGAHALASVQTHYASRFERFALEGDASPDALAVGWATILEAAGRDDLAAVWLLLSDPDASQVGLLTVTQRLDGKDETDSACRTIAELERRPSLSRHLDALGITPLFDRTSLDLAIWLPRSEAAGGEGCLFPTYPVHPLPLTGERGA